MSRIGVVGAGYVGLVTGVCLATMGHEVTIRDIDPRKVAALADGSVPIYEPGLEELIAEHRERLTFTLSLDRLLERSHVMFIAVDTPPSYSGDADLSRVMGFVDELAASGVDPAHLLAMKSTVPVGTGERVRSELAARGLAVGYCSNPEFLKEGVAIADFLKPDRVVIGEFDPADGDRVAAVYEQLDAPIIRTSVPTAEMIKYASNAFLATKISFINEIANVCEEVGADVATVAQGMGLDQRIGKSFLKAGIGFGGSCLTGDQTVLVRLGGTRRLVALEDLFAELGGPCADEVAPDGLEVLAWRPDNDAPGLLPVSVATRRPYLGPILEIHTKMGRRVTVTPDHPMVVADATGGGRRVKLAAELGEADWLPVAQGAPEPDGTLAELHVMAGVEAAGLAAHEVLLRPPPGVVGALGPSGLRTGLAPLRPRPHRAGDVVRSGTMRLHEALALGLDVDEARLGTARNGTLVPARLAAREDFWRVVGLYLAEGHCSVDGRRRRLAWSFHPSGEDDLVAEVLSYWRSRGVKATLRRAPTAASVTVSSRILASWWTDVLGMGWGSYDQRIPDLLWSQPPASKRALLAAAWRGDGSWSLVAGGPSVVLQYGTVSPMLADGLLRLLGELGFVARQRIGRTAKSTRDTYWLTVSGADQVEALLELVDPLSRAAIVRSIARQAKRIAPTGYRRHGRGAAWVRVVGVQRRPFAGHVYSLEVPDAGTFVTTGGLVVHNCFPKDVSALKQLAGNSGYHFQLLTAVIEVNELQKRRVVGKIKKHLGDLDGKRVALLGLAFKPGTDDMREASSLVLAARLIAEGAIVTAHDPVAMDAARERLRGVELAQSATDALRGADAAVLVTEWPEYLRLDWAAVGATMARPVVIDGRNALDGEAMRAAGYVYEAIGRS